VGLGQGASARTCLHVLDTAAAAVLRRLTRVAVAEAHSSRPVQLRVACSFTCAACAKNEVAALCPEPLLHCRLRFVKLYYEFPPSCLYSDNRGGMTA
jgi:hypothetical protein